MDINKILVFSIQGKAAHFKKYYSNKSSLTYKVPSRTVLMGMIASILKYPRDSYYNILAPAKAKFGVKIENGGSTHFECMNYLKKDGSHTQVRLQLLLPRKDNLKYKVYFYHQDEELLNTLAEKIRLNKLGYGVFFGQRQFRVTVNYLGLINNVEIEENYNGKLATLTYKNNINSFIFKDNISIAVDNMPISFKKIKKGRKPQKITEVCFEEDGKSLNGSFNQAINTGKEYISFYTPLGGN